MLYRLPVSLLLTSLLSIAFTSASAASRSQLTTVELPLTPENFTPTIAKGVWLVLYSTSWRDRAFAPTWETLMAYSEKSAGVQLARVDCSWNASEDLCHVNGVKGLSPQVILYHDGAFVELYKDRRDFDLLIQYLAKNAVSQTPSLPAPPALKSGAFAPGASKPVVTQDGFNDMIADGVWLVQYSLPWCDDCKRFAPTWDRLIAQCEFVGVRLARVDCDADRDLCLANKIQKYPQLNLYRDGKFAKTYHGSRDFKALSEYLDNVIPPPPILNPGGEVAILGPHSFAATVTRGPAFVSFYPPDCNSCAEFAPIWAQLAGVMRERVTIAEVTCWAGDDYSFCKAHDIPLGAREAILIYYPPEGDAKVVYTGPRTLAQLRVFVEDGGVYSPQAMESTPDTYLTVMTAPVLFIARVGMDTMKSATAIVRDVALQWRRWHGPQTVQFAREDPKRDDGVVGGPVDVDVQVVFVDHERQDGSRGQGQVHLTESSGQNTAGEPMAVESIESFTEQAMQYLYSADAYVMAHPLYTLLLLGVVYLAFRRCLRAEPELQDEKGLL